MLGFMNNSTVEFYFDSINRDVINSSDESKRHSSRIRKKRKVLVSTKLGCLIPFEAHYHGPRVVKSDIRHSYASMLANVFNACDFALLFGFFDTFCSPSFAHLIIRSLGHYGYYTYDKIGIAEAATSWCYSMFLLPDCIIRLDSITIYSSDDGSASRIECEYNTKATKVLRADLLHDPNFCKNYEVKPRGNDMKSILQAVQSTVSHLPVLENPIKFACKGCFTMYLNADKQMSRLEMYSKIIE